MNRAHLRAFRTRMTLARRLLALALCIACTGRAPEATTRVAGVAVDRSGVPLAHFLLRLRSGCARPNTEVETDDAGRFEATVTGRATVLEVASDEGRPLERRLPPPSDGEATVLRFDVGPLLGVRLTGEVPADRALALTVVRRGLAVPTAHALLRRDRAEVIESGVIESGVIESGVIRARWPAPARPPDARERVDLFVHDDAGHVVGHSSAVWQDLADGTEVAFDLERSAALDARPLDVEDEPVQVSLEWAGPEPPGAAWRSARLRWLPPGEVRFSATSRARVGHAETVRLAAGETRALRFTLPRQPGGRTVRGTVRAEDGSLLEGAWLTVSLLGEPGASWKVRASRGSLSCSAPDWAPAEIADGGRLVRFRIDDVPPGPLAVTPDDHGPPCAVRVLGPVDGDVTVEVVQWSDDGVSGYRARATDKRTGEALDASLRVRARDGGPPLSLSDLATFRTHPPPRAFEWVLAAVGHAPAWGDERDFRPVGEGRWAVEAALAPGWGTGLRVLDAEGGPVAGALALLDGREAGRSGPDGRLRLVRDSAPVAVQVAAPWGATVAVDGLEFWHTVRFRRR